MGCPVTSNDLAVTWVVWAPLGVVWLVVMVDLVRHSTMSRRARLAWAVVCTVIWPALIAYLLMRPTSGRLEMDHTRTDPRARLVDAVLDREAGRTSEVEWTSTVGELRRR